MRRAPWTIWRSTSAEVLRALLLAALSLVGLIAFVGAVRPLAEGRIGLADALALFALLSVPMLQFALPFAAGFAATISFHRPAAENETTAAHAAGIPHRTLLIPAVAIGIALGAALWFLANYTIPRFLDRAEGLIQRDLARIVLAPLRSGQTIQIGNFDIHADSFVGPIDPPPGSAAKECIALFGVLAVQRADKHGVSYAADQRVDLWLFDDPQDDSSTAVQLAFTNPLFISESGALSVRSPLTQPFRLPRTVREDPKFFPLPALLQLRDDPTAFPPIRRHTRALAADVATVAMFEHIREALASHGAAELLMPDSAITIGGASLMLDRDGAALVPAAPEAPIAVTRRRANGQPLVQYAQSARLRAAPADASASGRPTLTLELRAVTTLDPQGRVNTPKDTETYSLLTPAGFDAAPILSLDPAALLERAARTPILVGEGKDLRRRIDRLQREIDSKIHERAAYAAACTLMVILGAVVAMRLHDAMLLPVYLWSFLPALGAVITISAGQGLAHEQGLIGFVVLWAGVAVLIVITIVQFAALRRH